MTDLRITSPCAADWQAMTPNADGRYCSLCAKTVVDLACLEPIARDKALARIETLVRAGTRVCVRGPATRDGRLLSSSRRILTGGMAAMLAMTMAGCQGDNADVTVKPQHDPQTRTTPSQPDQPPVAQMTGIAMPMGDVAVPPPHLIRGEACTPTTTTGEATIKMGKIAAPEPAPAPAPAPLMGSPAPR